MVISPVHLLVDCLAEQGARFEGQDLSGGDRYLFAGLGIAPLAAILFLDDKTPEAGNLHGFSRLNGLLDCFQNRFQLREGSIFCEPGVGVYLIYEVCFCHGKLTLCL